MRVARSIGLAILVGSLCFAENVLYVTDTSGQTGVRYLIFGRPFAKGEILNYPKPIVNGQEPLAWQAHVMSRWHDGVDTLPIQSVIYGTPVVLTFSEPHMLMNGSTVKVYGVQNVSGTWRINAISPYRIVLLGSSATGSYSGGGYIKALQSPRSGSVKWALIAVAFTLYAQDTATIAFTDSKSSCGPEPCDTITTSELLDMNWQATMSFTQASTTVTINARTMIQNGHYEVWANGPVAAVYLVRDRSPNRQYDFGWRCLTNCTGDYTDSTWEVDTTYRSLHPEFIITAFANGRVKIDYSVELTWTTALQDQKYDVTFSNSSGTVWSKTGLVHWARMRYRRTAYDGASMLSYSVYHDMTSLIDSGALPDYARTVPIGPEEAQNILDNYNPTSCEPLGNCMWPKYFGTTGERWAIGYIPNWDVVMLYTWSDSLWPAIMDAASSGGHVQIHYRESDTSVTRYFVDVDDDTTAKNDSDDNVPGNSSFGRFISHDARPTWVFDRRSPQPDDITYVGPISDAHGVSPDLAHQPQFGYLAWLVTGDYWLMEEMQFWAAVTIAGGPLGTAPGYQTYPSYGILHCQTQTRGMAWGLRTIGLAWYATPDSMLEKWYILDKLQNNLSYREAIMKIKGENVLPLWGKSMANPCDGLVLDGQEKTQRTVYCFGWPVMHVVYNGLPTYNDVYASCGSINATRCDSMWQVGMNIQVYGGLQRLGLPVDSLRREIAKQALIYYNEHHNKYLIEQYRMPAYNVIGNVSVAFNTPWEHFMAYPSDQRSKSSWDGACTPYSYLHLNTGALAQIYDVVAMGVRGYDVWTWMWDETNVPEIKTKRYNCTGNLSEAKYAFVPYVGAPNIIDAWYSPGQITIVYKAGSLYPATIQLRASNFMVIDSTTDNMGGLPPTRKFVWSKTLSAGTYYLRLVVAGRYSANFRLDVQLAGDPYQQRWGFTCPSEYSVFSYGAVGNGTTDDTNAIVSAMNAAAGTGGCVTFGSGGNTFLVSSTLQPPSNIKLTARYDATSKPVIKMSASVSNRTHLFNIPAGRSSILFNYLDLDDSSKGGVVIISYSVPTNPPENITIQNSTLRNTGLYSWANDFADAAPIFTNGVVGLTVANNLFTNVSTLWIDGSRDVTITGNTFENSYSGNWLNVRGSSRSYQINTGYYIAQNIFRDTCRMAMEIFTNLPGSTIEGNRLESWNDTNQTCIDYGGQRFGFSLVGGGANNAYIRNNYLTGPTSRPIGIEIGWSSSTWEGNQIYGFEKALAVQGQQNNVIRQNQIYGSTDGIYFTNANGGANQNNTVTQNYCENVIGYCIRMIPNYPDGSVFSNNTAIRTVSYSGDSSAYVGLIKLDATSGVTISGNVFKATVQPGYLHAIRIMGSAGNSVIDGNKVLYCGSGNYGQGIFLGASNYLSSATVKNHHTEGFNYETSGTSSIGSVQNNSYYNVPNRDPNMQSSLGQSLCSQY